MKPTDLATRLTAYLGQYLPAQRGLSSNTIKANRDVFTLLLRYCRDHRGLPPEKRTLDHLDVPVLLDFLEYLEKERNYKSSTKNHRLCVLHSFFRYLQTEEPDRMVQCQKVLAIPLRRTEQPVMNYLSTEDLASILAQPDLTKAQGHRDAVLLSVLYDTGARVQELIDVCVRDVRLEPPAQIHLTGKGKKTRAIPLMAPTVQLLQAYIEMRGLDRPERRDSPLFTNRKGEPLSRSGVRYILEKYTERARRERGGLIGHVSPHSLRHSKAMHLLQAGNPPVIIRDILGHVDIKTTAVYARADLQMKRRALEMTTDAASSSAVPSWQTNNSLMEWLAAL